MSTRLQFGNSKKNIHFNLTLNYHVRWTSIRGKVKVQYLLINICLLRALEQTGDKRCSLLTASQDLKLIRIYCAKKKWFPHVFRHVSRHQCKCLLHKPHQTIQERLICTSFIWCFYKYECYQCVWISYQQRGWREVLIVYKCKKMEKL